MSGCVLASIRTFRAEHYVIFRTLPASIHTLWAEHYTYIFYIILYDSSLYCIGSRSQPGREGSRFLQDPLNAIGT